MKKATQIRHTRPAAGTSNVSSSGLPGRTNLRGGACVDVSEQVKSALQTSTTTLGSPASAPASLAPAANTTTTSG